jgi:PAS domain-containing protein
MIATLFGLFREDIVPFVGFVTALVIILSIPTVPGGAFSRGAKAFFSAAIGCYLIGSISSVLQRAALLPGLILPVISEAELLWIPFMLSGVYSLYARQQLNDAISARSTLLQTSEMTESIIETTPAGIMVLDAGGRITFANEAARTMLDLVEDESTGLVRTPGWTVNTSREGAAATEPVPDFRDLIAHEPSTDLVVTIEWPGGRRRRLSVNTSPATSDDGRLTGAVVAFVEREPWRAAGRAGAAPADA